MGECRDCAYSDRPIYKWPCDVCRATKNGRSMYCPEESDYIANDEGKTDYISRWGAQDAMTGENLIRNLDSVENGEAKRYARAAIRVLEQLEPADVRPVPVGGIGEMSDGYHTFNGLYYQRMVLFAALVKQNKDSAWKSHRHEDGELCFGGGWFIVGIDTPDGSYTYHYEDKDWDLFDCEELPVGKHWDGHTEDDVTRLLSLPEVRPVVYCRDCRWFYDGLGMKCCANHKGLVITDENGFCHHAKPKNGGTDG